MADFFLCDTTVKSISILVSKGILKTMETFVMKGNAAPPKSYAASLLIYAAPY
jgi:hypothetical protein